MKVTYAATFAAFHYVAIVGGERPDLPRKFGIEFDQVTTTNAPNAMNALVGGSVDVAAVTPDSAVIAVVALVLSLAMPLSGRGITAERDRTGVDPHRRRWCAHQCALSDVPKLAPMALMRLFEDRGLVGVVAGEVNSHFDVRPTVVLGTRAFSRPVS